MSLARYIQSLRRSKSVNGPPRSPGEPYLTSGYISDESDDCSLEDSLFYKEDMESDGKKQRC